MPRFAFNRPVFLFAFFISVAVLADCTKQSPRTSPLKVGVGETVITPAEPFQMDGFAQSQVSTGTHDDLHARSLVI